MPDQTMGAPEAEDTAASGPPNTCLYPDCGIVIPPARRGGVRKFCSNRHRAAYRDLQAQNAVRDALAIVQEAQDELDRLGARLTGAMQQLERLQHHGTRKTRQD